MLEWVRPGKRKREKPQRSCKQDNSKIERERPYWRIMAWSKNLSNSQNFLEQGKIGQKQKGQEMTKITT